MSCELQPADIVMYSGAACVVVSVGKDRVLLRPCKRESLIWVSQSEVNLLSRAEMSVREAIHNSSMEAPQ